MIDDFKYNYNIIRTEIKSSKKNYIICLKSNNNHNTFSLMPNFIFHQLIYFNLCSLVVNIDKNNFPIIMDYYKFYSNYKIILTENKVNSFEESMTLYNDNTLPKIIDLYKNECKKILEIVLPGYDNMNENLILLGKNKILIKKPMIDLLENTKKKVINFKIKQAKNIIVAIYYLQCKQYYTRIQNEKKLKKIEKIQALIKKNISQQIMIKYKEKIGILQKFFKAIISKKKLENIKKNYQFLSIRLQLYNNEIIRREFYGIKKNNIMLIDDGGNFTSESLDKESIDKDVEILNKLTKGKDSKKSSSLQDILLDANEYFSSFDKNNNDNANNENSEIKDNKESEKNIFTMNDYNNSYYNKSESKNNDNSNQYSIEGISENKENISNNNEQKNQNNSGLIVDEINIEEEKINSKGVNGSFQKLKSAKKTERRLSALFNVNKILSKSAFKVLQENCYLYKISKQKKAIKTITNFACNSFIIKYYNSLRYATQIIQNYMHIYLDREKIVKNIINSRINKNYINNINTNINILDDKTNKILFPSTLNNTIESNSTQKEKNNTNTQNNKNKLTTLERYKIYKETYGIFSKWENTKPESKRTKVLVRNRDSLTDKIPTLTYTPCSEGSNISLPTCNNIKTNVNNYSYNENKIYLLSKIVDVDLLCNFSEDNDIDEKFWMSEYKKIYEYNLYNKTPIQQIFLSDTHTLLLNNKGKIFLFGWNDKIQCGTNPNLFYLNADIAINNSNLFYDNFGSVKETILNDGYTILLNNKNEIYYFGDNSKGQLNDLENLTEIKNINSTGNIDLFLLKNNELYLNIISKKFSLNAPRQIFLDRKIKISSISCGNNFYILLTKEGKIYSSGSNEYGELCSPDEKLSRITPEEIKEISNLNEKIIQVKCGFKHCVILSENGNIYGWGNNTYGQLFSDNLKNKMPLIKFEYNKKIIQVCAGFRSTFFMDDNLDIFYFGIINCKEKNVSGEPKKFYITKKNYEYSDENEFIPVKLNAKWNKQFSLFYLTFADIRNFKYKKEYGSNKCFNEKIKNIIKILATKWLNDSINAPYINEIAKFFNKDYIDTTIKREKFGNYK